MGNDVFTMKDSLLCTLPESSPAARHLSAADVSRSFGNIADRHLSTRSNHALEWRASSPPQRDAVRRSHLTERSNACVWSASTLLRADNGRPTRPTLSG